jgi:hypothetical protein
MVEKTGLNKKVGSRQKEEGACQCHSDPALRERNLALP